MDLESEFPNGVIRNEKDVLNFIKGMDYKKESAKCGAYCDRYVAHKENATQKCLNRILELIKK